MKSEIVVISRVLLGPAPRANADWERPANAYRLGSRIAIQRGFGLAIRWCERNALFGWDATCRSPIGKML
jgi:hypothetical protein